MESKEPKQPPQPDTIPPIQPFRVGRAVRCTWDHVPTGINLVCPREQVTGAAPSWPGGIIWQEAVLKPKNRVSLAYWDGKKMMGMASARRRAASALGGKAWEIDRLYLYGSWPSLTYWDYDDLLSFSDRWDMGWYEDFSAEDAGLELLEQLITAMGNRSAERVFLRMPAGSPALTLARRSGFVSGYEETLLEGYGNDGAGRDGQDGRDNAAGPAGMRPKQPQDDYALFQLFCASAPAAVKKTLGLTFDQWQETRDGDGGLRSRHQEWVAEEQGRLVAWLRLSRRWVTVDVQGMTHPDYPQRLYPALDFALAQPGIQRWLVPDYQEGVADRLRNRGFRQMAQYIMLVKPVAVPVLDYGMAPVEA